MTAGPLHETPTKHKAEERKRADDERSKEIHSAVIAGSRAVSQRSQVLAFVIPNSNWSLTYISPNVFASMAFFRKIYDEIAAEYPEVETEYNYVDAQALNLIRHPWDYDVMVMENMFGDILSDLAGGLVGGMGMAACAEIGDKIGLFQPAHGSAPEIMDQDKANPLAAILSGALMLDYLAEKSGDRRLEDAAECIEQAIEGGFVANALRPMEFGGDMGTRAVTNEVLARVPVGKV